MVGNVLAFRGGGSDKNFTGVFQNPENQDGSAPFGRLFLDPYTSMYFHAYKKFFNPSPDQHIFVFFYFI